jgi:phage gp46-like protein
MVQISIQPDLSCPSNAYLAWDTIWNRETQQGDWARAADGSLKASAGIATCAILALMTDKACPADHPLAPGDGDLRGWWATPLLAAQGIPEMGSLLWLLENKAVNETNRRYAETFALDALAPLIAAGLAVKASATATILPRRNGVTLAVALYGSDGAQIYAAQFDVVWAQIGR